MKSFGCEFHENMLLINAFLAHRSVTRKKHLIRPAGCDLRGERAMNEQEENKWHRTTIRVRYKDTDRMGVVYYGNYLTFFEVGRAEFMRDLGFAYAELEKKGLILVVTEAGAKYHANVGYDALVTIMTKLRDTSRVRVRFDYRVIDEMDRLLVSGHTVHACLNEKQRASRLPEELRKVLNREIGS